MELHRQRAMGKDIVAVKHVRSWNGESSGRHHLRPGRRRTSVRQHAMRRQRRWNRRRASWLETDGPGIEPIPKGLSDRWRDPPPSEITGDDLHFLIDEIRNMASPA